MSNCVSCRIGANQSYWNSAEEGKGCVVEKQKIITSQSHLTNPMSAAVKCVF